MGTELVQRDWKIDGCDEPIRYFSWHVETPKTYLSHWSAISNKNNTYHFLSKFTVYQHSYIKLDWDYCLWREIWCCHDDYEEEGSRFLWNVAMFLPDSTQLMGFGFNLIFVLSGFRCHLKIKYQTCCLFIVIIKYQSMQEGYLPKENFKSCRNLMVETYLS